MKMLFLTERFPPSEGGSRVYYYNLCKNYHKDSVIVLTKKVEGAEDFDRTVPFKVIRKGKPLPNWKYYQLPRMVPLLFRTIHLTIKENIGVIHCGDFFPAGAVGLVLKKLFGKPYVYYVHGEGYTWFDQFRFQPKIRKVILKNADVIVAACSYAEEGVNRDLDGRHQRIVKINPGVDYERFVPDWRDERLIKELGLEGRKIILTVGRLIDRKGQDTVIKCMPRIVTEIPDAVYLICGRGRYEETLRSLATDLGVAQHVKFLGYVPNDKLPSLYSICDVFVMVNRETRGEGPEGFGMVFAEASASGKPVIGGRSGGNEDSIVDGVTGYRIDPHNADEVAACIIKVLNDPELAKRLGRNGREWVVKNCDWREKAKQLEALNRGITDKYAKRDSETSAG